MKFIEAVPVIETYFMTNYSTTNILMDNAGGNGGTEYVDLKIHPSHTQTVIKNNGATSTDIRYKGLVSVYVYTEKNKGSRRAMTLAQEIVDIFSHQRLAPELVMRAGDIQRIGEEDEYYRYVADIPYVIN